MLFCHVTSLVDGDPHQGLLREKGGTGFPYLIWMDADGNIAARQRERSVEGFQQTLATLLRVCQLEAEAAAGDRQAAVEALISGLRIGRYDFEQAKARREALGEIPLDAATQIETLLVDLEVQTVLARVREREQVLDAGRHFLAMLEQERVPTGRLAASFYSAILEVHADRKDAKAYAATLDRLRKLVEGERGAARMLKRYEDVLARLEEQAKGD